MVGLVAAHPDLELTGMTAGTDPRKTMIEREASTTFAVHRHVAASGKEILNG